MVTCTDDMLDAKCTSCDLFDRVHVNIAMPHHWALSQPSVRWSRIAIPGRCLGPLTPRFECLYSTTLALSLSPHLSPCVFLEYLPRSSAHATVVLINCVWDCTVCVVLFTFVCQCWLSRLTCASSFLLLVMFNLEFLKSTVFIVFNFNFIFVYFTFVSFKDKSSGIVVKRVGIV